MGLGERHRAHRGGEGKPYGTSEKLRTHSNTNSLLLALENRVSEVAALVEKPTPAA
jgi:hypothetical protein